MLFLVNFSMSNGTRQGGILSPYLFSRYIREVLVAIDSTAVGCFIGNHCFDVLVYADDICTTRSLLAWPSTFTGRFTCSVFIN